MGRCILCEIETETTVSDMTYGSHYLCDECKNRFKRCEICKVHYLEDELDENDICHYCNDK